MDLSIDEANFMETLGNGAILCQLALKIDTAEAKWRYAVSGRAPTGKAVPYCANAKSKSFEARDNVALFLQWARVLGVPEVVLFTTEDLILVGFSWQGRWRGRERKREMRNRTR